MLRECARTCQRLRPPGIECGMVCARAAIVFPVTHRIRPIPQAPTPMSSTRRDFLQTLGVGAVAFSALPLSLDALAVGVNRQQFHGAELPFDLTWPSKIHGTHRAVFDVAGIDSGFGVWRASLWENQYKEFMGAKSADISPVMVIRSEAIILGMQQSYWDAYRPGHKQNVKHPLTEQVTNTNPVLMSSTRNEVPPVFDSAALDQFIKRGGIALACNLAFEQITGVIEKEDKVSAEAARTKAISMLVPGVMLQPSGIFAVVRAQEAGAQFVRAS